MQALHRPARCVWQNARERLWHLQDGSTIPRGLGCDADVGSARRNEQREQAQNGSLKGSIGAKAMSREPPSSGSVCLRVISPRILGHAVYYATAIVVGSIPTGIVDAVCEHLYSPVTDSLRTLMLVAEISIVFGAGTAILFGFFLRVLTRKIGQLLWHWTVLGAVLGPCLILCLSKVAYLPLLNKGPAAHLYISILVEFLFLSGPVAMINSMGSHVVQLITATAVISGITASTLCFITRRFGPSSA